MRSYFKLKIDGFKCKILSNDDFQLKWLENACAKPTIRMRSQQNKEKAWWKNWNFFSRKLFGVRNQKTWFFKQKLPWKIISLFQATAETCLYGARASPCEAARSNMIGTFRWFSKLFDWWVSNRANICSPREHNQLKPSSFKWTVGPLKLTS